MEPAQAPLTSPATRLRILPPQSGWFFPAIVLGPMALIMLAMLVLAPRSLLSWSLWTWVILPIGLWSLFECVQALSLAYFILPEGIQCRRMFSRHILPWLEVEAVGQQEIRSRSGVTGLIIFLYGAKRIFKPTLHPADAYSFLQMLGVRCPQAIRIDEVRGTFDVLARGDGERLRALVARHAQRLRRQHGFALAVCGLVLIPVLVMLWSDALAWNLSWNDGKTILACLVLFTQLSAQHWATLWRLRR
jgi:hypothetical protein